MAAPTFVGIRTTGWVAPAAASVDLTALAVLAGDLIVGCIAGRGMTTAPTPTGFTLAQPRVGPTITGNLYSFAWFKTAVGGEGVVTPSGTPGGDLNSLMVAVYRGLAAPHGVAAANSSVTDLSTGPPNPTISPLAGRPAVIVGWQANNPNYFGALPAGYTFRAFDDGGATPRTLSKLSDVLVDPTVGPYAGSYSGAGGETSWLLQNIAFMTAAASSFPGEPGGGVW